MAESGFRRLSRWLQTLAGVTTAWVGSSMAFVVAALLTLAWLASGPLFHFSDTWQLVMNTISSIVTFLMVFLLQRSQNKEFMALQLKLNELLAAKHGASNRLINAEDLTEEEVADLHQQFRRLHERLLKRKLPTAPASIERVLNEKHDRTGQELPS